MKKILKNYNEMQLKQLEMQNTLLELQVKTANLQKRLMNLEGHLYNMGLTREDIENLKDGKPISKSGEEALKAYLKDIRSK